MLPTTDDIMPPRIMQISSKDNITTDCSTKHFTLSLNDKDMNSFTVLVIYSRKLFT